MPVKKAITSARRRNSECVAPSSKKPDGGSSQPPKDGAVDARSTNVTVCDEDEWVEIMQNYGAHSFIWGCLDCHHEWQGGADIDFCDWCGGDGSILGKAYKVPARPKRKDGKLEEAT